MRKIIVQSFLSLDGVMQAPGGTTEDTSGGFRYGGWTVPYAGEVSGKIREKLMAPADLLLGRKTFAIWENYWPARESQWPGINEVTKYVLSSSRRRSDWSNCVFLDGVSAIHNLKHSGTADLKVWGSSELVHLLLEHSLVDELWLMTYPVVLGEGKRLFATAAAAAAFTLEEHYVSSDGVIMAHYRKAGTVQTGTMDA